MKNQVKKCLAKLTLIAIVLITLTACGTKGTEPTAVPTIVDEPKVVGESEDEQPAEMVWAALDSAINYISSQYGEQAFPPPGMEWSVENVTPEGLVGTSTYRFAAGDLTATVAFPLVAPDATIFEISVDDNATGFHWLGSMDTSGQVNEQYAPLFDAEGEYCIDKSTGARLSYTEAVAIAEGSECGQQGQLKQTRICNQDTGTWWIDLELDMPNCNPACVVDLNTGKSEINGRCMGVLPPDEIEGESPALVPTVAPTAVPSAIPAEVEGEVSEWVLAARQSTLDYINEQYGEEAPALDLAWTGGITDPETPTVGWSEYQFSSGKWLITIGHPVVLPELIVYEVAVTNQTTGFEWEGEVDAGGEVTEILGPASEQLALCWYGRVESTPEDAAIDRYLVLLPEEARSAIDLVGVDETVEAEIEALRDSGTFAHFWGTLDCSVPTWGGCQLVVDRLRPEGPEGPIFDPEPVVGWMGSIISNPTGAQFDDYFEQSARFRMRYGIEGADNDIDAQLTSLRDAASIIRVWGQVMCPVVDVQGSQIQVDRIEVVMEASSGEGYEGWRPYINTDFGYAVWYPGEYTVMGNNPNESVQFAGQDRPVFMVQHYDSDFYHPPAGVDLQQWLTDHNISYDAIDTEVEIAGLDTVHISREAGPGSSVEDMFYFITDDHLFKIYILPDGDQQDWDLNNRFLQSFTFDGETESTGSAIEGWTGTVGRYPTGSQHKYYFDRADEKQFIVGTTVEAVNEQIDDAAWSDAQVELYGQLGPEMPNHIYVTRLEVVSEPSTRARNLSPFATPSASSVLPSDHLGTYHEWSVINGFLESPWCEGVDGSGVGQWLMLEFPALLELAYIGIDVGYDYNDDIFFKNNRIKNATLIFSDGTELPWEFDDVRGLQLVPLACAPGPCTQTTFVKLVIDEVYPGSRYDDACIAEIEVWGNPR